MKTLKVYPGMTIGTEYGCIIINGKHFDDYDVTVKDIDENGNCTSSYDTIYTASEIKNAKHEECGQAYDNVEWEGEEETMKITLYGYMGLLGHEYTPVWTAIKPADMNCVISTTVTIPANLEPYETESGDIAITLDGMQYTLNEVLQDRDENPAIVYSPYGTVAKKVIKLA